jgi:tRNA(fMet)-specific endonuclease VapC
MTGSLRYLLDTNIVSDLARNPQGAIAQRIAVVGSDCVAISIIVAAEIRFGLAKLGKPPVAQRLVSNVAQILAELPVLAFESPADEHYGDVRLHLEQAGTPIGANDLLIAAHARAMGLILVTNNEREFARVPALTIENWLTPP